MKKNVTKALAVVAAVAMVSMTSVSAFAETTTSGTTTVKYDVTAAYTWTVPAEINFTGITTSNNAATVTTSDNNSDPQNVKVTQNVISEGNMLRISLDSSNTFKIKSTENAELSYGVQVKTASNTTAIGAGGTVLDVKAGTNTGSAVLVFTLKKDTVEKAGNYTGSLTYSSQVVSATTPTDVGTIADSDN